jgi:30S ribosomal protein S31
MGRGDKKSKRGKLIMGSFGISRKKRKTNKAHAYNPVSAEPKKETVKKAFKPVKVKVAEEVAVAEETILNTDAAEAPKKAKAKAATKKVSDNEEAPKKEAKKKTTKKDEE